VFVATGAQQSAALGVAGEELAGVADSLTFLRQRALGEAPKCGKVVAVVGGGDAAVDAARTAVRLGAGKVMLLYRRTREAMPAYKEEVEAAVHEGVELHFLVAPSRILGKNGSVVGIELARMELGETDQDGRRRPTPVGGSEFVLECDMVISAIGQNPSVEVAVGAADGTPIAPATDATSAAREPVPDEGASVATSAAQTIERGRFVVDPVSQATPLMGVFAGGDCVTGGATVIAAVAAGQKAAISIDRFLGGRGELPADTGVSRRRPSEEALEEMARVEEVELPVSERIGRFVEVLLGLDAEQACAEACRCLRCDLEREGRA
jgi:NADPH-dependent glutamate synthase beta subunit-like oxidoreductase